MSTLVCIVEIITYDVRSFPAAESAATDDTLLISFGAVLYEMFHCTARLGRCRWSRELRLTPFLYDLVRCGICMTSLLYCLAWCCRWSRELCLSRSCTTRSVRYCMIDCTAWLGAVGGQRVMFEPLLMTVRCGIVCKGVGGFSPILFCWFWWFGNSAVNWA